MATDKAGNQSIIEFGIDKDKPKISGVTNGASYKSGVTPVITDLNLDKVTYTFNGGEAQEYIEGMTFSEPGEYTIKAVDKAGNTTTVTFTIEG